MLSSALSFSQASLQDYADCPRRFQLRYVLGVRWPADRDAPAIDLERRARQGAAFHLLVHQHTIGIPRETLERTIVDDSVRQWWGAYLHYPPCDAPRELWRSEVRLGMPIGDFRLSARYDLLVIEPGGQAIIVDWKTTERRPRRAELEHRFQTLVYPFVLVEAGAHLGGGEPVPPHRVELLYWFAEFPRQVERFAYDEDQHMAVGEKLSATIAEIAALDLDEWPLTPHVRRCAYCPYRTLCDRDRVEEASEEQEIDSVEDPFDLDLEQIAEVEF